MKLAIVILQYNGADHTYECVESILPHLDSKSVVILVDNASPIGFHDLYTRIGSPPLSEINIENRQYILSSQIHVLRNNNNTGYGQGNNIGAQYAVEVLEATHIWILNNDTRPAPDALSSLRTYLIQHPEADLIGHTILDYGTSRVQALAGARYNPVLGVGKRIGAGTLLEDGLPPEESVEPQLDYLTGASFVISRKLYEQIGLFDPAFFLYFEEMDLARRAAAVGVRLRWASGVRVEHKEGASISPENRSELSEYHATLSSLLLTRKHYPLLLPITLLVRLLYKVPRYALQGRWKLVRAHLGGLGEFLRRLG